MCLSLYCFYSHFLIVNCMCAWLSFHALPHALATHLHPCSSPTPAGLLLVRSSCLVALLLHLFTHKHKHAIAIFHSHVCFPLASGKHLMSEDSDSPDQHLQYITSVSFSFASSLSHFLPTDLKAIGDVPASLAY